MTWQTVALVLGLVWAAVALYVGVKFARASALAAMVEANPGKQVNVKGV